MVSFFYCKSVIISALSVEILLDSCRRSFSTDRSCTDEITISAASFGLGSQADMAESAPRRIRPGLCTKLGGCLHGSFFANF